MKGIRKTESFRLSTLLIAMSLVALSFSILKLAASSESFLTLLLITATLLLPVISYSVAMQYENKSSRWMVGLVYMPLTFLMGTTVFLIFVMMLT